MDKLVVAPGEQARHIVVQRGGRFWRLAVLDMAGDSVPLDQLHTALHAIIEAADLAPAPTDEHLGLLTTLPRREWAALRTQIAAEGAKDDAGSNAASLNTIDSALFVLGLDRESPEDANEVARCFLHGDGIDRWLD